MIPRNEFNRIELLFLGLEIIVGRNREEVDWLDTDFFVIHKQAMLTTAPEHSNEGYISIAVGEELPQHHELVDDLGWSYEYPYYVFYLR